MTRPQPLISNLFPRPGRRPVMAYAPWAAAPTPATTDWAIEPDPHEPEGAGDGLDGEPGCLLDAREGL